MQTIMKKWAKIQAAVLLLLLLAGCSVQNVSQADAKEPVKAGTWVAYWDLEAGGKDLQRMQGKIDKLSYFAAYFNERDQLFVPAELMEKRKETMGKKTAYESYLTIVNDKQNTEDSATLKDTDVLRQVLTPGATMDKHIQAIIDVTLQGKYDGIEIDYERIWTDEQVAKVFPTFIERLYQKAKTNNLKVRVVLEPGTPFATVTFPTGPEYVVMFYNLYGTHSDPGPKANKAFIEKLAAQMKTLPGEKNAAFATGGCLWEAKGQKSFITEVEAKTLAMTHDSKPQRDKDSQCLFFSYKDSSGSYQVWYADAETLRYWIGIANQQGISHISLWRAGGNMNLQDAW